jgi:hypothetical protein
VRIGDCLTQLFRHGRIDTRQHAALRCRLAEQFGIIDEKAIAHRFQVFAHFGEVCLKQIENRLFVGRRGFGEFIEFGLKF